jgi:3-hydroxyisobutyrate dehydrogenase
MAGRLKIGWIGVGVMGKHMCGHLMAAGHSAAVYSRTASKCSPLVEKGARLAATPLDAARGADVVFTMVGAPQDVNAVTLGDSGVLQGMSADTLLVDFTTSTPSLAQQIALAASEKGVLTLDAPVSGGDLGAQAGTLSIMCGGTDMAFLRARPLLELLGGEVILHMGDAGAGQHTKVCVSVCLSDARARLIIFRKPPEKPLIYTPPERSLIEPHSRPACSQMCNQILGCNNIVGVAESLRYAQAAGLDASAVIKAIGAGAAGSWAMQHLGPRLVARDFAPGFMIEHMAKDLGIAVEEAERLGLSLPGLANARKLYDALLRHGHGRDGTQALILALEDVALHDVA